MNKIIKILMERDGMDENDANELYKDTMDEINEAFRNGCSYNEIEDIMADNLCLEMDWLI